MAAEFSAYRAGVLFAFSIILETATREQGQIEKRGSALYRLLKN